MKKLLALMLAVLMIASLSVTGFAATVGAGGSESGDVEINITDSEGNVLTPDVIYNVVITWQSLVFKVEAESAEWNTTDLKYDLTGAEVPTDARTITVTNNSNAAVAIAASFPQNAKTAASHGITATLAGADGTLVSAVNRDAADTMEYSVSLSGTPTQVPDMTYIIDTIKVTVSASN